MLKRGSGVLLHIISLPSPFGIGDLGEHAYKFVDFLSSAHQSYWQVLPLNPSDSQGDFSPYSSNSSFALNPLFIDPLLLVKQGLVPQAMVQPLTDCTPQCVAYEKVTPFKMELLQTAFSCAEKQGLGSDFFHFCEQNASWLDEHALFTALSRNFKYQPWNRWPPPSGTMIPKPLRSSLTSFTSKYRKRNLPVSDNAAMAQSSPVLQRQRSSTHRRSSNVCQL
jgi:4-alpha-glucanotransferase